MITNERIDELLRQKAKIWGVGKQGNVFCVGLKFRPETLKNKKWLENKYEVYSKFFETEEEAKWFAEFGCIERTERLELPTYKKSKEICTIVTFGEIELCYFIHNNSYCLYRGSKKILDLSASKESYTLACRKVKELFLGKDS